MPLSGRWIEENSAFSTLFFVPGRASVSADIHSRVECYRQHVTASRLCTADIDCLLALSGSFQVLSSNYIVCQRVTVPPQVTILPDRSGYAIPRISRLEPLRRRRFRRWVSLARISRNVGFHWRHHNIRWSPGLRSWSRVPYMSTACHNSNAQRDMRMSMTYVLNILEPLRLTPSCWSYVRCSKSTAGLFLSSTNRDL